VTRVVLLTDFGTADGYAAAMAGVIAAAAPDAIVEHASHDIAPGDVLGAAIALARYASRYPAGTVHLVVVDPGVGTGRRALAADLDGRRFVAPDNGVLTLVLAAARDAVIVAIDTTHAGDAAPTFHGRDIFAPAAARLARGEPLHGLGTVIDDPVLLPIPEPAREPDAVRGQVLHVDRFGNLITNIPAAMLAGPGAEWRGVPGDPPGGVGERGGPGAAEGEVSRDARGGAGLPAVRVLVEGVDAGPVRRTYGDVAPGELVSLIGSLGLLEVSVRDGSAAERLGVGRGARVRVAPGG
jgi:S-adenosyl-L-methionine hydrolase (adenosine-forming)